MVACRDQAADQDGDGDLNVQDRALYKLIRAELNLMLRQKQARGREFASSCMHAWLASILCLDSLCQLPSFVLTVSGPPPALPSSPAPRPPPFPFSPPSPAPLPHSFAVTCDDRSGIPKRPSCPWTSGHLSKLHRERMSRGSLASDLRARRALWPLSLLKRSWWQPPCGECHGWFRKGCVASVANV